MWNLLLCWHHVPFEVELASSYLFRTLLGILPLIILFIPYSWCRNDQEYVIGTVLWHGGRHRDPTWRYALFSVHLRSLRISRPV